MCRGGLGGVQGDLERAESDSPVKLISLVILVTILPTCIPSPLVQAVMVTRMLNTGILSAICRLCSSQSPSVRETVAMGYAGVITVEIGIEIGFRHSERLGLYCACLWNQESNTCVCPCSHCCAAPTAVPLLPLLCPCFHCPCSQCSAPAPTAVLLLPH